MTRKEEIKEAARIRANQYSHPVEWNDCYRHWIEGAEWADKTLLEKVCEYLASNMRCDGYTTQTKAKFIQSVRKALEE